MKKFLLIPFVLFASLFFASCEKEYSTETGGTPNSGLALYTLDGGSSTCTGAVLNGTYKAGVALGTGNTVVLQVDVDSIGGYTINTGAVNGITFSGTGTFSATGPQTITLTGSGTPTAAGDFTFSTGAASCSFSVTVAPDGGSSGGTAVYTFDGGTSACAGSVLGSGTYTAGTATGTTNTVQIGVNVTTIGTYTIATSSENGISFSGSGTFTTTGPQTITLTATGTPSAAGDFNYTVGAAGCTFSITVAPGSSGGTDFIRCKIDGIDKTFNFFVAATEGTNSIEIDGMSTNNPTSGERIFFDIVNNTPLPVTTGTYIDTAINGLFNTPVYTPDITDITQYYTSGATTGFSQIFTVIVTVNSGTRIEGTFSGILYKADTTAEIIKTVSEGTFGVDK